MKLSAVRIGLKLRILAKKIGNKFRLVADCCCVSELLIPMQAKCQGDNPQVIYITQAFFTRCPSTSGRGIAYLNNCYRQTSSLPLLSENEARKAGYATITNPNDIVCIEDIERDCPACNCCTSYEVPVDPCQGSAGPTQCCEGGTEYALVYAESITETDYGETMAICLPTCFAQPLFNTSTSVTVGYQGYTCACNDAGQPSPLDPRCGDYNKRFYRRYGGTVWDAPVQGCTWTPRTVSESEDCYKNVGQPDTCPGTVDLLPRCPVFEGTTGEVAPCNGGTVTRNAIVEVGSYTYNTTESASCSISHTCQGGTAVETYSIQINAVERTCGPFVQRNFSRTRTRTWEYIRIRTNDCDLNACSEPPPIPTLNTGAVGNPNVTLFQLAL